MCRRIVDKDSTVWPPADISDRKKDDSKGKNLNTVYTLSLADPGGALLATACIPSI